MDKQCNHTNNGIGRDIKQCFYDNGQICVEQHFLNGEYHNENGPAYRSWWKNGQISSEQYWLNDKLHNENGPAIRSWDENGQISSEAYYLNSELHNENAPAYRRWWASGKLRSESYYLNGERHNENAPAYLEWYENGQIYYEAYYSNGELHNENGPAYRSWWENGQIRSEEYRINGITVPKEELNIHSKNPYYTVIAYRPNYEEWQQDFLLSQEHSKIEIKEFNHNIYDVGDFVSNKMMENLDDRGTCFNCTILIDGKNIHNNDFDKLYPELLIHKKNVIDLIQGLFQDKMDERKNRIREKELLEKNLKAEALKKKELEEYELYKELSKKYANSNPSQSQNPQ